MISVRIGQEERSVDQASDQWINEQLRRRRADGASICAQVILRTDALNMVLSTPQCQGGGRGRPPNEKERQLLDLWQDRGLNEADFSGGNLIAFLHQVRRAI
jgi:hypothetical protein